MFMLLPSLIAQRAGSLKPKYLFMPQKKPLGKREKRFLGKKSRQMAVYSRQRRAVCVINRTYN